MSARARRTLVDELAGGGSSGCGSGGMCGSGGAVEPGVSDRMSKTNVSLPPPSLWSSVTACCLGIPVTSWMSASELMSCSEPSQVMRRRGFMIATREKPPGATAQKLAPPRWDGWGGVTECGVPKIDDNFSLVSASPHGRVRCPRSTRYLCTALVDYSRFASFLCGHVYSR